jgi:hypothetical protein
VRGAPCLETPVPPPTPHVLASQTNSVSWFSDPIVNGTFLASTTFQITLPCTPGVAQPMRVRVSSTEADGGADTRQQIRRRALEGSASVSTRLRDAG